MGSALSAMGINLPFLISQIVNFLILFGLLTFLLWKPAKKKIDERQEMLEQQRKDAEAAAEQREKIQEEREEILEEAREKSQEIISQAYERVEEIKTHASQEADQVLADARKSAREEQERILKGMREKIIPLAIAAANQLVKTSLDESRQRELVNEFFSKVKDGKVDVLEGKEISGNKAVVVSALPLHDEEKEALQRDITGRVKGDIQVEYKVNPDILGGIIIRIDDQEYDSSVAGQLAEMRSSLN